MPREAIAGLGHDKGFLVMTEFTGTMLRQGFLCRDMGIRFKQWKLSQHGLPCCDKGSSSLSLLCRNRGFQVMTETAMTKG